jgi:hypothetical protein
MSQRSDYWPPLERCPNRPARGWCPMDCELCHGCGHVPATVVQQLEGRRWDG